MYLEFRQFPDRVMDLVSSGWQFVIRTTGSPYAVVPPLKRTVNAINGNVVSYDQQSMEDEIRDSLLARRFTRMLLAVFAALAMALATISIYGVVSCFVTQSTHDIGVCMALHQSPHSARDGVAQRTAHGLIRHRDRSGRGVRGELSDAGFTVRSWRWRSGHVCCGAVLLAAVTMLASYVPAPIECTAPSSSC